MAYFKTYYSDLKSLEDKINNDIKNVDKKDNSLFASMVNFAKSVQQLRWAAANNSAIENKASQMPEGVETAMQPLSNG